MFLVRSLIFSFKKINNVQETINYRAILTILENYEKNIFIYIFNRCDAWGKQLRQRI
jgi:hypothetical protein